MTTRKPTADEKPADDVRADDDPTDAPAEQKLPGVGTVVRLDNPELDGHPQYALVVGEQEIVRLGPATRHEIETYPAQYK